MGPPISGSHTLRPSLEGAGRATLTWSFLMKDSWPLFLTASNGILLCWLILFMKMLVFPAVSGSRGVPPISGSQTICLLGRKFGNPSTLILLTGRSGFVDFLLKELAPQRGGPCIVFSNQGFMASIDSRFSLSWGPPISGSETICPIDRKFGNPSTLILLTGGSLALP